MSRKSESHGEAKGYKISPEYRAWQSMKQRCLNEKDKDHHHYGGRNIKVCDRWLNSFIFFLADMGRRPTNKHSIDRKDNNGNYSPDNCQWATAKEQNNNQRGNRIIVIHGVTYTIARATRLFDIPKSTLLNRLNRGMESHEAIFTP